MTSKDTIYFFIVNFVVIPIVLGLVFYTMAIISYEIEDEKKKKNEIIARVSPEEEDFKNEIRFKNMDLCEE